MAIGSQAQGGDSPLVEINTTPLIDVLLVLLIMFIVTLPLVTNITRLDLQRGPGTAAQREVIHLEIDFDGTLLWNGEEVALTQLESRFRREAMRPTQPELRVQPAKRVDYDTVAKVLALAQRNGLELLGVVGE